VLTIADSTYYQSCRGIIAFGGFNFFQRNNALNPSADATFNFTTKLIFPFHILAFLCLRAKKEKYRYFLHLLRIENLAHRC